jgi:tetratricopeptide (TPR) repeat protein
MDLDVLAVYPHAHYLATLMEAYATLPDGTRKWLVRIPRWDLSWQGVFQLKKPLRLPKDTVVSMRYHYDNSSANPLNPNSPPAEVRAGNHATDEMSHFWFQALPVGDKDQRAALEEALTRHRLEKYPGDFSANFTLGDLMMNQNNPGAAIPCFRIALLADPKSSIAAGELGAAYFANGQTYEAEQQYRRALDLDPKYIDARYNLASVEANNEEWPAAAENFQKILEINPEHKNARQRLGEVLFLWGDSLAQSGKAEQAAGRYQQSLQIRPDDADLHAHFGAVLMDLKRWPEAKNEFEAVLHFEPDSEQAKQALVAIDARQRLSAK